MEKKILPYLVVFSALSVSLSAAFYSVTGLSKMFSGASIEVMIMMGSLEVAKLVLASLLYQYWSKLNAALKGYYFIALFVLMCITSAGIYGYLSSAYSETSIKIENIDREVGVLDIKRNMFQDQLAELRIEKQSTNENISTLSGALSNNNIQFTNRDGQVINTTSSANRRSYESQLEILRGDYSIIQTREIALTDSITSIDLKKLELESNSDLSGEVGALKYISRITGKTMDQVINWFIVALMLVFDPLAVSLVVGANVIFKNNKTKSKGNNLEEEYKKLEEKELEIKKRETQLGKELEKLNKKEIEISESNKNLNAELKSKLNSIEEDKNELEIDKIEFNNYISSEKEKIDIGLKNLNAEKTNLEKDKIEFNNYILSEEKKLEEKRNQIDKKPLIVYPKKSS